MDENNINGTEINFNPEANNTGAEQMGYQGTEQAGNIGGVASANLPTQVSVWTKIKNFLFQDITVELTPKQQKVENEINDFLHQEVNFKKVHDFLFQEISFGKKN